MPDLLDRNSLSTLRIGGDERLARAELRRQIGRLERHLADIVVEAFPRVPIDTAVAAQAREPRALSLGELEEIRDALAARIEEGSAVLRERAGVEAANRLLLEQMLEAPAEHKWMRISNADIGLPGCGHWHSRPRLGLLGMLMGWWRVRVSSGCPLAGRLAAVERDPKD